MKVKILKYKPVGVVVKNLETGDIVKYPKQFFNKRYAMGLINVQNPSSLPKAF